MFEYCTKIINAKNFLKSSNTALLVLSGPFFAKAGKTDFFKFIGSSKLNKKNLKALKFIHFNNSK
jgi:hypothetical protein